MSNQWEIEELRQRIDDLERRLTCIGDDSTIGVEQTDSGQIIELLQDTVDPSGAEEATNDYINVSYDSGTEKFTVTVTGVPALTIDKYINIRQIESRPTYIGDDVETSETFIFDKPASFAEVELVYRRSVDSSNVEYYKIGWAFSGGLPATTTDTSTQSRFYEGNINTGFAEIKLNSDGTSAVTYYNAYPYPVIIGHTPYKSNIYVDTTARNIILQGFDPLSQIFREISISGYTEPVSDTISMAWNDGDSSATAVLTSDASSYDRSVLVGTVRIDSNNYVTNLESYSFGAGVLGYLSGYSGTANSSATLTIVNGRITDVN